MKRTVIILAIGFLLVFGVVIALISRGSKQTSTTALSISIWSPFDEGAAYEQLIRPLIADSPELKFSFKFVKADNAKDYEAKVVDAIAGGNGPDIWLIRSDWLPKHRSKLIPSTVSWSSSRRGQDAEKLLDKLPQAVIDQNILDNQLYGVPLATDTLALYINTAVVSQVINELSEAGSAEGAVFDSELTTWAELERWSRLLTRRAGPNFSRSGLAIGTVSNTYAPVDVFLGLLNAKGGRLFESDSSVGLHLASERTGQTVYVGQETLDFYASFATNGHPNYSWNVNSGDPVAKFVEGRVGLLIGFSSLSNDFSRLNRDFDKYKVVALPQPEAVGPANPRRDLAIYWTNVVPKSSANPDLAWRLIQSILTKGQVDKFTESIGRLTPSDSSSVFAKQLTSSIVPFKPEWQAADEVVQDMISQKQQLGQPTQSAIDSAVSRLKEIGQ